MTITFFHEFRIFGTVFDGLGGALISLPSEFILQNLSIFEIKDDFLGERPSHFFPEFPITNSGFYGMFVMEGHL